MPSHQEDVSKQVHLEVDHPRARERNSHTAVPPSMKVSNKESRDGKGGRYGPMFRMPRHVLVVIQEQ